MSEERLEILRMVSDGKISVDEAERLMKALDEGERKRATGGRGPRGASLGVKLEGLGEALGGIGSMVHGAVQDALDGVGIEIGQEDEEEDHELHDEELVDGGFVLPRGARLVIKQRKKPGVSRGGDLVLQPGEGDRCVVQAPEGSDLKVRVGKKVARIQWNGGPMKVQVPPLAASVTAKIMGGDIRADGIMCPLEAKTMGGNITLDGVTHPFEGKTMGGNVQVCVQPELRGECKAHTMGGDVTLKTVPGARAVVTAVTMGGRIDVPPEVGRPRTEKNLVKNKAVVTIGPEGLDEPGLATVSLKTMGGDIKLRADACCDPPAGPEEAGPDEGSPSEPEAR